MENYKGRLIIHETDCHGCGVAHYNGKNLSYAYDDGTGDLASAVRALIQLGFLTEADVKIFEGNEIYDIVEEYYKL